MVFGSYLETRNDPNITNNMSSRNNECIELRPTGNIEGKQKLFLLNSGIVLKRRNIIPMISSYQIIKIVKDWRKKSIREHYGNGI